MTKTIFTFLFAGTLLATQPSPSFGSVPGKLAASVDSGSVEFNATGRPSALKIKGVGTSPKGTLLTEGDFVSGNISFDLDSLETGIKLRDEHMKTKYLETGKYREAVFTITKLPVPQGLRNSSTTIDAIPFQGVLSLHGTQRPVSGKARVEREGDKLKIAADFGIKVSDFNIPTPGFAGITMAEDVQVLVRFTAPVSQKE